VTIITTPDGREWYPSTSQDKINCTSCGNVVDNQKKLRLFLMENALFVVIIGLEPKRAVQ